MQLSYHFPCYFTAILASILKPLTLILSCTMFSFIKCNCWDRPEGNKQAELAPPTFLKFIAPLETEVGFDMRMVVWLSGHRTKCTGVSIIQRYQLR
jgi:hypothetical protein